MPYLTNEVIEEWLTLLRVRDINPHVGLHVRSAIHRAVWPTRCPALGNLLLLHKFKHTFSAFRCLHVSWDKAFKLVSKRERCLPEIQTAYVQHDLADAASSTLWEKVSRSFGLRRREGTIETCMMLSGLLLLLLGSLSE